MEYSMQFQEQGWEREHLPKLLISLMECINLCSSEILGPDSKQQKTFRLEINSLVTALISSCNNSLSAPEADFSEAISSANQLIQNLFNQHEPLESQFQHQE